MQSLKSLLSNFDPFEDRYISREFQKYAYNLAKELDDTEHKSIYMKLAKTVDRTLLEETRRFVKDARNPKSKGKLFMWKLKQLREESKISNLSRDNAEFNAEIRGT